jgi:hypothetical protein
MSGSSSGGGTQSTTINKLPAWEEPFAKAYLSSMAGQVFPGTTLPSNFLGKNAPNFGQNSGGTVGGQAGSSAAGSGGGGNGISQLQGALNPLAQSFLGNSIGGSSYLQGQAQNNPAAILGASSPQAMNQLAQLYPNLMGSAASGGSGSAGGSGKTS